MINIIYKILFFILIANLHACGNSENNNAKHESMERKTIYDLRGRDDSNNNSNRIGEAQVEDPTKLQWTDRDSSLPAVYGWGGKR